MLSNEQQLSEIRKLQSKLNEAIEKLITPQDEETISGPDQLLPCPFCGTTDHLKIGQDTATEDGLTLTYAYHVFCSLCGCHGRNNYPIGWVESESEARAAWNHRGTIRPF